MKKTTHLLKMNRLKGFSVLVTGGSSGIGKEIALAMGSEGANVAVNYISKEDQANQIVKTIKNNGIKSFAYKADVSDPEQVKQMFEQIKQEFGTIDILVNNAGMQKDSPFIEMSFEDWQKVLSVNLTGSFLCSQQAAKEFISRGVDIDRSVAAGKIIFISSVHERIPWANHCNYAASKGGMSMLMKTIAQELAPHKIRVNSVAPGAIKTPINKDVWSDPESKNKLMELIPYGRIGDPEDIANVAVWLASDESDYVNGATIYADGGMTLYPGFAAGG